MLRFVTALSKISINMIFRAMLINATSLTSIREGSSCCQIDTINTKPTRC